MMMFKYDHWCANMGLGCVHIWENWPKKQHYHENILTFSFLMICSWSPDCPLLETSTETLTCPDWRDTHVVVFFHLALDQSEASLLSLRSRRPLAIKLHIHVGKKRRDETNWTRVPFCSVSRGDLTCYAAPKGHHQP